MERIHVGDGADLFQALQIFINRGERERGNAPAHRAVDLLRARVLARGRQRLEDGQPLAGHRETMLAAEGGEFGQVALHDKSCASDLRTGSDSSVRKAYAG